MVKRMVVMLVLAGIVFGGVFAFIGYRGVLERRAIAARVSPPIPVSVMTVRQSDWVSTIPSIGLLEAAQGVDVTTSVGGLVTELLFDSGQAVTQGEVLVRLDASVETGQLRQAQAQLPAAQATLQRYRALAAQGNTPQANVDNAQSTAEALRQQIQSLQAQVDRKVITAPFEGVLGVRRISLGQLVNPGTVIANLQNTRAMRMSFIISQRDFARIRVGHPVEVAVDAYPARRFAGVVTTIEPSINAQSGVVRVQAEIQNAEGLLRSGMFATIEVILPEVQHVVVLPAPAISFSLYGTFVYTVRPTAATAGQPAAAASRLVAERVAVETGERRGNDVVVTRGLSAGDRVVTVGQLRLQNGAPVAPTEQSPLRVPATAPVQ
ncbi:MAG: efflux RND transporter periplasmic adaptor subunit [Alphaproteobacteria bacterium]|nr:efflux RND transporter periplasmic adaptor subunit [Alphaproteobacteria bacterium]